LKTGELDRLAFNLLTQLSKNLGVSRDTAMPCPYLEAMPCPYGDRSQVYFINLQSAIISYTHWDAPKKLDSWGRESESVWMSEPENLPSDWWL